MISEDNVIRVSRFPGPPPPSTTLKTRQREEIERQTREYLSRGGEITSHAVSTCERDSLPSFNPTCAATLEKFGKAIFPPREFIAGRWVVRMPGLAKLLGKTEQGARNIVRMEGFPKPLSNVRPLTWDEDAVKAWVERTA
jgi:predicted DNA-binding transcriptional regulator AlpA